MFRVSDVLQATGGMLSRGGSDTEFYSVSTDTRKIKEGSLFIAIKGGNFDGHDFIQEAIEKGARGVVVSSDISPHPAVGEARLWRPFPLHLGERAGEGIVKIKVEDTVKALGDIAGFHRRKFGCPIIAITGSNGKTTTKEMISAVLGIRFNVLRNEGTENNFIGVPLTLLRLDDSYDMAVVELGSNHSGEIGRLAEVVKPDCAVIVSIGASHLEFFKTVVNVRREKLELLKRLGNGGIAVVNGDDAALSRAAREIGLKQVVTFGLNSSCDLASVWIKEDDKGIGYFLRVGGGVFPHFETRKDYRFFLNLAGRYNVCNALAATAVGLLYGIGIEEIIAALRDFKPPRLRMEITEAGGVRIIFDCYNANPSSMAGAIEALKTMSSGGRKIVVAGDMLELGDGGPDFHREAGRLIARAKVDILIGVGPLSRYFLEGAREEGISGETLLHLNNSLEAAKVLKDIVKQGDLVLVKGSRGMKMEEIKDCFTISYTH